MRVWPGVHELTDDGAGEIERARQGVPTVPAQKAAQMISAEWGAVAACAQAATASHSVDSK